MCKFGKHDLSFIFDWYFKVKFLFERHFLYYSILNLYYCGSYSDFYICIL